MVCFFALFIAFPLKHDKSEDVYHEAYKIFSLPLHLALVIDWLLSSSQ